MSAVGRADLSARFGLCAVLWSLLTHSGFILATTVVALTVPLVAAPALQAFTDTGMTSIRPAWQADIPWTGITMLLSVIGWVAVIVHASAKHVGLRTEDTPASASTPVTEEIL
ncbi:hypothetical protein DEJ28_08965 [Curtobacterium sp. MCPF17_002]|uniref:hypothetical protein n=1 Tax=Curtobacterium sp. MCPF17_002 TaxID=2175645 RepID=UPI000DA9D527|nr:hypothetical protein [Curtobacterium sp. MCPF17_002]WIB79211.1 hypothetical protein DEJ28_08965 [Curtobacterium sp. MCPF17_002]